MYQLASRIAAVAVVVACGFVTGANAEPKRGGGGPGPAPAPHVAAPPAPHISAPAPHISAPAHIAAPHISAPAHVATPHIATPHMPTARVAPHVNVPHIARGQGLPSGVSRQVPHGSTPHIAATPRSLRGTERRLSRAPASTPSTQGRANVGNARDLNAHNLNARGPNARDLNAPNLRRGHTPSTVGSAAAGTREHGLGALTRAQRDLVDRSQQHGAQLNHKGTPVLRNPALASMSRRNPETRRLADATFKGNFAEHGRDFDHDRFRDHRHRRFPIVLGWIGPVFWPYAYDDFVDYTFYPVAYDVFWPYAYDDVYDSFLGEFAYGTGGEAVVGGRRGRARVAQSGGGGQPQVCAERAPQLIDLPIERIAQTVQPDEAQRAALDDLKGAIVKAVDVLQSACPTDVPTTPLGRLQAMHDRLDAMLLAVQTVRPALDKFYDGLSDEQKARFDAIAIGQDNPQQARRDLTQVCSERATVAGGLPVDRIESVLRLSGDQRRKLDDLQKASLQAADQLKADCPTEQPVTPVARLQAMEQRLNAMLKAIETVQPTLEAFTKSLSDEQKARFNTLSQQQA
jgi:hypothetical protein